MGSISFCVYRDGLWLWEKVKLGTYPRRCFETPVSGNTFIVVFTSNIWLRNFRVEVLIILCI